MLKIKVKTLIGVSVAALLFLTVLVAFLFFAFPQKMASATGLGPLGHDRILTLCALTAVIWLGIGWGIEKLFDLSGRAGCRLEWIKKQQQLAGVALEHLDKQPNLPVLRDNCTEIFGYLRQHYGRFWPRKIRLFWVIGENHTVDSIFPNLREQQWQQGDGMVMIYGGDASSPQSEALLTSLSRVCSRRPPDGVILAMNNDALPTGSECQSLTRHWQKMTMLSGWQIPLWLWLVENSDWSQSTRDRVATGILLDPGVTPQTIDGHLDSLIPGLRQVGMAQLLSDPRHDWLLRLASHLQAAFRKQLITLCMGLTSGLVKGTLQGIVFSSVVTDKPVVPHACSPTPEWQVLLAGGSGKAAKRVGFHWQKRLRLLLLILSLCGCGGTLLSLAANGTQIYQLQETARSAVHAARPLAERLRSQSVLQQTIARLQYRTEAGVPWYMRFGLSQNEALLDALWPLYAHNNKLLMCDPLVTQLKRQLMDFVRLPPASEARMQGTHQAYNLLRTYLMLTRPDKADAGWLANNALTLWPHRRGVAEASWQLLAPGMLSFYAQNLPRHPDWKVDADMELITAVRQILLRQIGQRNAELGLYQTMLKSIAHNWPDLTLADMTGDTDASTLFSTDQIVPGMFTRQAWEDQVQNAIDELVKTRRSEIDWVLSDKTVASDSDISPDTLKAHLTARYFNDFGNAWLNMVNHIQWHDASSLAEAIAQLNILADVRQSPLVALMNTLLWQGKTGEKSEALADSLVDSAKNLISSKKRERPLIRQSQEPKGPLDGFFGPLTGLMAGKEGTGNNGNLSFQSWLARVIQVRLKLQQVTTAPDPQAMAQMLAQTVFQGKSIDLTETRDYGSLVAASLGQAWNGFGQALFVRPLDLAWRQVLTPAADSLNSHWQTAIVAQWNTAFAGRYPFKATGSDASLPLLGQFLRADSGRITTFLKTNLGGILHQEGNRWGVDPSASQGITVNPAFLNAINQLAEISDIIFSQGDAGVHFELMARPSRDVARMQLTLDGQNLDYFNQMASWQSFTWPGNTYYPGADLSWHAVNGGMRLYASQQGNWGVIRLLDKARVTPIDSSRSQLVWPTPENQSLKFILRSELGEGPLTILKLQGFRLPDTIFNVEPGNPGNDDVLLSSQG